MLERFSAEDLRVAFDGEADGRAGDIQLDDGDETERATRTISLAKALNESTGEGFTDGGWTSGRRVARSSLFDRRGLHFEQRLNG